MNSWLERALCAHTDPTPFITPTRYEEAKQVCALCPVIAECREWAITTPRAPLRLGRPDPGGTPRRPFPTRPAGPGAGRRQGLGGQVGLGMTGSEHLDKLFDKPAAHRRHWSLPPVNRTVLIRTGAGLAALVIVVAHSGAVLTDIVLGAPLLLVLACLPAAVLASRRARTRHLPRTPHPNTNSRKEQ